MVSRWAMILCFDTEVEFNKYMRFFEEIEDSLADHSTDSLEDYVDKIIGPIKIDVDNVDVDTFIEDIIGESYEYFIIWYFENNYKIKRYGLFDVEEGTP